MSLKSSFNNALENFKQRPVAQQVAIGVGALATAITLKRLGHYMAFRMREKKLPFNAWTTNEEAINGLNLQGKIALVTGGNNGIGKETARILVKQGCNVVIACRAVSKGESAKRDILESLQLSLESNDQIEVMQLDLASLKSVELFAKEFNSKNLKIDYLINNAGVMALSGYQKSTDGYEMQFATNHLGHFYLTHLLLPSLLRDSESSDDRLPRIINLSSSGHRYCPKNEALAKMFDDSMNEECFYTPEYEGKYNKWVAYGISKACNILFGRELQRRYDGKLIAVSVHPGAIATGLGQHLSFAETLGMLYFILTDFNVSIRHFKSLDQSAATTLRCVSMNDDEIGKGDYYENCQSGDVMGWTAETMTKDKENGGQLQQQLWKLSETLIRAKGFSLNNTTSK